MKIVVLTIYICTINLLLLFDNTTEMTHLKIKVTCFIKEQNIRNGAKEEMTNKDKWEDGYNNLQKKKGKFSSSGLLPVPRTYCVNSTPICVHYRMN